MSNETEQQSFAAIQVTSEFKRNIRQLAKKYRRIKTDLQPLLDELAQGQTPGDQITGVQYEAFKVRVRNSDSSKGKSGGYRVIYQRTTDGEIILVTIYSKTEQGSIAAHEIRQIIVDFDAQRQAPDEAQMEASEVGNESHATIESEADPTDGSTS